MATQILEKYDPSRLPGKSAEIPGPGGRPAGGATGRPQPMVVAASPHGGRQPISTPRGGGMDLRKEPNSISIKLFRITSVVFPLFQLAFIQHFSFISS